MRRMTLGAVALLGLAAVFGCGGDDERSNDPPGDSVADHSPKGVTTFNVRSADHVDGLVEYERTPPAGGDHSPTWWNCGSYDQPIFVEAGVHSLEHGAVWITYSPSLDAAEVGALSVFGDERYVLVSPWENEDLPSPIVASAWGAQLKLQKADYGAIVDFLAAYRQAPTSPEPGAPCTGGRDFATTR